MSEKPIARRKRMGGAKAPIQSAIAGPQQSAYDIVRTKPDEILRHDISDDELTRLTETKTGYLSDALWAFVGGVIGSSPGAIGAGINYFRDAGRTLPVAGLGQLLILAVCVGAASVLAILAIKRERQRTTLLETIRARSRSST
jgi:hypothetical protein